MIFCSWCNQHEFKVHENTIGDVGIVMLTCPACRKVTSLGRQPGGELIILPGVSEKKGAGEGQAG